MTTLLILAALVAGVCIGVGIMALMVMSRESSDEC